jgi:hypothetical protein
MFVLHSLGSLLRQKVHRHRLVIAQVVDSALEKKSTQQDAAD